MDTSGLKAIAEAIVADDRTCVWNVGDFARDVLSLLSDKAALEERVGVLERAIAFPLAEYEAATKFSDHPLRRKYSQFQLRQIVDDLRLALHHPEADLGKGEEK